MKFLVLGPLDVDGNGEGALGGPKQRAVLGMLVSRVGEPVIPTVVAACGGRCPERASPNRP